MGNLVVRGPRRSLARPWSPFLPADHAAPPSRCPLVHLVSIELVVVFWSVVSQDSQRTEQKNSVKPEFPCVNELFS